MDLVRLLGRASIAVTTMGDLFGKLVGLRFGKTVIHKGKTAEGSPHS
jgi:dolichol kinase